MYEMVDKEYIRKRHFVDGWSIREISRTLKISRQTVRKMLNDVEVPKYQLKKARPCPVMDRWKPVIEAWLRSKKTSVLGCLINNDTLLLGSMNVSWRSILIF